MSMYKPDWFRFSNRGPGPGDLADRPLVWVIHASETGVAEDLADETCRRLKKMGIDTRLLSLEAMDLQRLQSCEHTLFLVSTTGDGEPPCAADAFADRCMRSAAPLSMLQFAVLALGDRRYDAFCAFGRQLHDWLRSSGAQPIFDRLDVDDEDPAAISEWHERLTSLAARMQAGLKIQKEPVP